MLAMVDRLDKEFEVVRDGLSHLYLRTSDTVVSGA